MGAHNIISEIAGTVWEVRVKPGDSVETGDEIIIIESMKMEIPVLAEESGVIDQVLVEKGAIVAEGQPVASVTS